ncbi:6203_t:CDS:2 [Paraglomus occultum]|uniref:6203_t:CDS:1 n=1 Tax=Paraglomus occultum TaxID=144539 RepID=A0A9N9GQW7_9GLOM|nr:6203_t:CDS:2 [Paraglomus occultum]
MKCPRGTHYTSIASIAQKALVRSPLREDSYNKVIGACALVREIEELLSKPSYEEREDESTLQRLCEKFNAHDILINDTVCSKNVVYIDIVSWNDRVAELINIFISFPLQTICSESFVCTERKRIAKKPERLREHATEQVYPTVEFEHGDKTEVGEKGLRIALARAVYSRAGNG